MRASRLNEPGVEGIQRRQFPDRGGGAAVEAVVDFDDRIPALDAGGKLAVRNQRIRNIPSKPNRDLSLDGRSCEQVVTEMASGRMDFVRPKVAVDRPVESELLLHGRTHAAHLVSDPAIAAGDAEPHYQSPNPTGFVQSLPVQVQLIEHLGQTARVSGGQDSSGDLLGLQSRKSHSGVSSS